MAYRPPSRTARKRLRPDTDRWRSLYSLTNLRTARPSAPSSANCSQRDGMFDLRRLPRISVGALHFSLGLPAWRTQTFAAGDFDIRRPQQVIRSSRHSRHFASREGQHFVRHSRRRVAHGDTDADRNVDMVQRQPHPCTPIPPSRTSAWNNSISRRGHAIEQHFGVCSLACGDGQTTLNIQGRRCDRRSK